MRRVGIKLGSYGASYAFKNGQKVNQTADENATRPDNYWDKESPKLHALLK